MRRSIVLTGVAVATLWTGAASAGSFDTRGVFAFDERAVYRDGFEAMKAQDGFTRHAGESLEGGAYANVETSDQPVRFPIALPAVEGSYRARMFARKNRIVGDIDVEYTDGRPAMSARFFPTGVVTSDGWYEVQTATFSVGKGATVNATLTGSDVDLDALEIVPEGTFETLKACKKVFDPVCGPTQVCSGGYCREGRHAVPELPADEYRDSVVEYLKGRMKIFFGGRSSRETRLPLALALLDKMKTARDAWAFWNGYTGAVRTLRDWHTTTAGPVDVPPHAGVLPACFVEGSGDLSQGVQGTHAKYPDVLVSHVGPNKSVLKAGDRLLSIDGKHPLEWAESLEPIDWSSWRANDPRTFAELAERLRNSIRRYAESFTFVRCTAGGCEAPQTIKVAELPANDGTVVNPSCDNRPAYHLKTGNPDPVRHNSGGGIFHGLLADSAEGEDLYGMIWSNVFFTDQNPYEAPYNSFRANAKGLILDHRTGNGGYEHAAEYLTTLFRTPEKLGASTGFLQTVGLLDTPFTTDDAIKLFDARKNTADAYDVGAANPRTDLRTALLLARDGSASDWFPLGMKGAPNVRIFGRRTAGAFSSFIQFEYYGQLSWQLASGDLIGIDGKTHIGSGVEPDEELLPRQSDLVVGKDTVYERALSWVRGSCGGGCP